MPRYFIHGLDTYVGRAVGEEASRLLEEAGVVITGSAEDPKKNKPKWCREAHAHSDSAAIKDAMLKADVIVFDIVHAQKEATAALKILLKAEYEEEKTLIAVSSILSWADTPAPKPAEDDEPVEEVAGEEAVEGQPPPRAPEPAGPAITYKHVAQRRPHSSLRALQTTENLILQKGNVPKDQLRTYVVWPGVLYGCGEGALHPLFKAAWKGEQPVLPILEGGKTVLPMIHVRDLAAIVVRISEKKPEQKEYLAVDDGRCKQGDIVKAVATSLQDGSVTDMNTQQYLAWMSENDATTEGHLLPLQLHLKVRFSAKDALDIPWTSLSGFVANITKVTEEFRLYRAITAMKVVFMGPPASGKSFYAALMSQEYEVQHILVGPLIKEAAALQNDLGAGVRAALAVSPRLTDTLVADIIKTKLATPGCKNQGWILDGFPKNAAQARLLFNLNDAPAEAKPEAAEGGDGDAEAAPAEAADDAPAGPAKVVAPEIVVQIDAEEEFLLHRVMAYPQDNVQPDHDDEAGFKRRYDAFVSAVKQENSVVDLLVDSKARLVVCMAAQEVEQNLDIMRLGFGRPRNYDPERAARQREARAAEERARAEEAARMKAEADAEAERRQRAQRELEERERLQEIMAQEREALETRSLPMRQYLVDNVLPLLTKGLLEVGRLRPEDPIDFLAEYLFKNDVKAD